MSEVTFVLAILVAVAIAFDFTNGFHDTANAMATSIATRALPPKVAVGLSAVLNLVGAFLSIEVALTVSNKVVAIQGANGAPIPSLMGMPILIVVLAGLVGAVIWNILTWLFGIPSSSSHAMFGGLIGSSIAALGIHGVKWTGVFESVVLPAVAAPFVAGIVSTVGTALTYRITRGVPTNTRSRGFRWGQIGSASLVSLAHGTNDAQKTMGVITLALIASGHWTHTNAIPIWVKFVCAAAIASGTYIGGWRVIRTLGKGLVEIDSPQGMAAEMASAAIILSSSHAGMALSTTHVATGSILGTGLGKKGAEVRWSVAGRMALAWVITLPASALVGSVTWFIAHSIGGAFGAIVITLILIAAGGYMFWHARRQPIHADNVNDDWGDGASITPTSTSDSSTELHPIGA